MVLIVHHVNPLKLILLLSTLYTLSGFCIHFSSVLDYLTFIFSFLVSYSSHLYADCYDPLDPNGNFSITFDINNRLDNGYLATVTLQNYHQYRHVDKPGWKLGWTWANNEVIWSMSGAIATDRGDCSSYSGSQMPHSCKKDPIIVDISPDVTQNRSDRCCRGGRLSARAIDSLSSLTSFELQVRNLDQKENSIGQAPKNVTFMAPGPGYTCSPFMVTDPSVSLDLGGVRQVPVIRTWKSICTYSSFLANKSPVCCVSFSTFYNPIITPCRNCTCGGCREADKNTLSCIRPSDSLGGSNDEKNIIRCTDHMCPIRVHWHFQNNYMNQWRVKLTISNYNFNRNYSNWNALVQHPGFSQKATTYSFNSTKLPTLVADGVALFWGIDYFNNELMHSDKDGVGSVTTEILLEKDQNSFTLQNGWAFPRRIYFNGENCDMPLPDTFPMLPNGSYIFRPNCLAFIFSLISLLLVILVL